VNPTAKEASLNHSHCVKIRRHQHPANSRSNSAAKNNLLMTAKKMKVTSNQSTNDRLVNKIFHDHCPNVSNHLSAVTPLRHQHPSANNNRNRISSSTDKRHRHQHHSAAKRTNDNSKTGNHRKVHTKVRLDSDRKSVTKPSHQVAVMPSREVRHQAAKLLKFWRQ
jgi:recombination DNA repair RAD52 pathway protein